ncbi:MAG: glycosyltransferase family 2 protein [Flavobacterium sp.]|uniref:glycosyltransferase family 2 protein n=1 Tax=Flavobacterium sp. TaxID=239 RepID=UPI0022BCF8E1|nr:glycosyltransferase family 2 protein [Flavobacterium sp.]MCZ8196451.1 glycosyltransferase family 2 protein [Flavobacterium sp.]
MKNISKLSVALCTYNGEKFLKEQIDSILNQTISVDEIIICDDCSSDSTIIILNEYNQKHPNLFKIYINEFNLRSTKNFEKAISLATGDYIFLSDQDDVWRKDKVEKTLEIFSKNPIVEGVFSNANLIDDNSNPIYNEISLWESFCFFHESIKEPSDLRRSLIHIGNFLTGATLCIKKEVKDFSIPFLTSDNFIHDEWLAYILTERNTLMFSTEKLISYRLHQNQQLGVGKLSNPEKTLKNNREYNHVLMDIYKPKRFKDCKAKVRFHYSQYEKYYTLYEKHRIPLFKNILDDLKTKFIESNLEMKKKYPIRYFFRIYSDKRKGKRQLKES